MDNSDAEVDKHWAQNQQRRKQQREPLSKNQKCLFIRTKML